MNSNQYVVKHKDKWAVRSEGSKRVSHVTDTQKEAINIATRKARANHSELRIQGKNGKFRECNSYGNDPFPPRG